MECNGRVVMMKQGTLTNRLSRSKEKKTQEKADQFPQGRGSSMCILWISFSRFIPFLIRRIILWRTQGRPQPWNATEQLFEYLISQSLAIKKWQAPHLPKEIQASGNKLGSSTPAIHQNLREPPNECFDPFVISIRFDRLEKQIKIHGLL